VNLKSGTSLPLRSLIAHIIVPNFARWYTKPFSVMKLPYVVVVPLLSFISSTAADGTCSSSGSRAWPPVGDCSKPSKFDTAVQTCRACCLNDQPCFTACLKGAGLGTRDIVEDEFRGTIETKRELGSRAIALSCGTNENCYKYTDGSLLCLNLGTGTLLCE
jgi:hypothetical protein